MKEALEVNLAGWGMLVCLGMEIAKWLEPAL
jgi:hypothetical protein